MSGKGKYKIFLIPASLLLLLIILKLFCIDYYKVNSSSMTPAILPGSYIFTDKLASLLSKDINVRNKDIVVFYKPVWGRECINSECVGPVYVKRCFGMPGDTIRISKPDISSGGYPSGYRVGHNLNIYPHDSGFDWSINKMGPLWIPKRGATIELNAANRALYSGIIAYEGRPIDLNLHTYTFKCNYYFFLGDNFYASEDSRFWGLVPETHLIGKVFWKISG